MEYQHIYVISKFSPIFPKGFKEFFHDIYIHTSPDFFNRVFQGAIRLITRPQEDQNWLQGYKKNKLIKEECYEGK